MERNRSIDLAKFIMSICVIAIHSQLFKNMSPTLYNIIPMGLMRLAVPLFFVISGYYFYQKLQQGQSSKRYLIKLIQLFIVFETIEFVLYLPFSLSQSDFNILSYLWKSLTIGLGGAYWYIVSLILSLLSVKELWKKQIVLPLMIVGFVLYLAVFSVDSYAGLFNGTWLQDISLIHTSVFTWPQAGLCSSLFYISIGAYLYKKRPIIHISLVSVISCCIMLMIEAYILQGWLAMDANCYLSLLICVPIIFLYLLQHPYLSFETKYLGSMSIYIYMSHCIVLTVLRTVLPTLANTNELLFILATLFSVIISFLIIKIKGQRS